MHPQKPSGPRAFTYMMQLPTSLPFSFSFPPPPQIHLISTDIATEDDQAFKSPLYSAVIRYQIPSPSGPTFARNALSNSYPRIPVNRSETTVQSPTQSTVHLSPHFAGPILNRLIFPGNLSSIFSSLKHLLYYLQDVATRDLEPTCTGSEDLDDFLFF